MATDYTEYFRRLYERADEAVMVPFRAVHLDAWEPAFNKCHENVDYWVRYRADCTAVRGWIFWPPDETRRRRFMAHSVVEMMGEFVDITPIERNTPREKLLFLRHLGSNAEFEPMKTAYSDVVYPPFTWEEWRETQPLAEIEEARESREL